MNTKLMIGVVLMVLGGAMLAYRQINYRSRETVLEVGPIKATAERTRTVPIPSILGWTLLVGGAGVVVLSARSKS